VKEQTPELTIRAALTGAILGGVLSLCNIYSGLKVGWGFNMAITAALLGFGFWRVFERFGMRPFNKLENTMNLTAASAGAFISGAGLVSAMPALTMMTGQTLPWVQLAVWTFLIGCVGVLVGVAMRRQLIEIENLPFAAGVASAETLDRIYSSGAEAMRKVSALLGAAVLTGVWKAIVQFGKVKNVFFPGSLDVVARRASLQNFTFSLDPSLLLVAVGAIGTLRAGVSMLAGAIVAWLYLGPMAVANGWAEAGAADPTVAWYTPVLKWLLWPGVALMVTSSLTSVAFSWRSIVRTFTGGEKKEESEPAKDRLSLRAYAIAGLILLVAITIVQMAFFGIRWWAAILAVLLTFVLAAVAGRVSGETTITPVGAMGKVTQLVFGLLIPANPTANLMCANVTGGAASQSGDMLHDLKTGALVGASPRRVTIAQTIGVLGGALAGSAAYLVLLPDPQHQIGTPEWPAPSVQAWKAVAELFQHGFSGMPRYALSAMAIGAIVGIVLTVLEKVLPEKARRFVPSPSALGLGFVVHGWYGISLFIGAVIGAVLRWGAKDWSERYLTPIASGMIAGETLMGVGIATYSLVTGASLSH
jgi:putative OPT family oligopeptide transporter